MPRFVVVVVEHDEVDEGGGADAASMKRAEG